MKTTRRNNTNSSDVFTPNSVTPGNRVPNEIDAVKHAVFVEYQPALGNNDQLLRVALIEAEALAHQTAYPQLVFPLLADEKAQNAARWQFRQRYLLRSSPSYALAA